MKINTIFQLIIVYSFVDEKKILTSSNFLPRGSSRGGGGGCIVFIFLSFLRFGSIGREGTGSSGEIARLPGNSISSSANLITGSDTGNWGGV